MSMPPKIACSAELPSLQWPIFKHSNWRGFPFTPPALSQSMALGPVTIVPQKLDSLKYLAA